MKVLFYTQYRIFYTSYRIFSTSVAAIVCNGVDIKKESRSEES